MRQKIKKGNVLGYSDLYILLSKMGECVRLCLWYHKLVLGTRVQYVELVYDTTTKNTCDTSKLEQYPTRVQ